MTQQDYTYEVLNPWADADPQSLRGLSPRVTNLDGKTLGLVFNFKLAARPILSVVEEQLKQRYPTLKTRWYESRRSGPWDEYYGREKDPVDSKLQDWLKGVDAVVAAVGD